MKTALLVLLVLPAYAAPSNSEDGCAARDKVLAEQLGELATPTRRWANLWGMTWTLGTVAQLSALSLTHSVAERQDLAVGALSSALGLIPTWIFPPSVTRFEAEPLEPHAGDTGACDKQAALEAQLQRSSQDYRDNTGILAHGSNLAVNLGVSLILGAGLGHWNAAALSAIVGIPIGELMILTYPKGPLPSEEVGVALQPSFDSESLNLGLALVYRF